MNENDMIVHLPLVACGAREWPTQPLQIPLIELEFIF